ncbi:SymE family type I addiction module toxin [Erwinia aphidicola]
MDEQDCNAEIIEPEAAAPELHHCRVGYVRNPPKYWDVPLLRISGQWLADAGFPRGTPVEMRVVNGCIMITVREQYESRLQKGIRIVRRLPESKQRRVEKYVARLAGRKIKES